MLIPLTLHKKWNYNSQFNCMPYQGYFMFNNNVEISHTNRHPRILFHCTYNIHTYTGKDYIICPCAWFFLDKYQFYMWFSDRKQTTEYCLLKHERNGIFSTLIKFWMFNQECLMCSVMNLVSISFLVATL